jgi:hypothetical protein
MKQSELKQIIKEELLAELVPVTPMSAKEMLNIIANAEFESILGLNTLSGFNNFDEWYEDWGDNINQKEEACVKLFYKLLENQLIYIISVDDSDSELVNFPKAYSACYWSGDGNSNVILMLHNIK